ncbi:hypothetical protein BF93_16300 [Brachybacterium phenoliresistens]|uniref:HTH gntR-type domain-containing protein n=1 Tax=Brachybacterium phenoliresistens TaxID=396014 RepID=Z9JUP3_9MICO|nr:FCD domain-containing protein [Brachybacterium phenoliresistens]EWS81758.1 hypothetical protein BF93_16300 [Brachybacterium phenoliresistens]
MDSDALEFLDTLVREGTRTEKGIRLPTERRLAEISGLSRSQVRERLSGLQMLGMLQKVQGSGNMLVDPSTSGTGNVFTLMQRAGLVSTAQIAQAREMLEIAIAPRILEHVTEAQILALEQTVHDMIDASAARDFAAGLKADHDFHLALFDILDNPIMTYMVGSMNQALHDLLLERRRVVISREIAENGGVIPEMFTTDEVHFEITRALRSRRREAVSAAMVEHFERWRRVSRPRPHTAPAPRGET